MKYCPKCKVSVKGTVKRCPLCQSKLSGEADAPLYPVLDDHINRLLFVIKILAFVTVIGVVVSLGVNIMTFDGVWWSLYVVLGVICLWLSLSLAFKKKNNIPKNIVYQTLVVSAVSVIWDYVMGWKGWSLDYVIPIACIIAMISLFTVGRVLRLYMSDYIVCIFIDALFGILQVVFYLTGLLHVQIPSFICIMFSLISLAGVFIFISGDIKKEFVRRFHI